MRNWFITGVSSGLGRAVAEAALAAGDSVAGTLRRPDALAPFEALAPGRAHAYLLDVTDEEAVAKTVADAERVTGGIDIILNNAGYSLSGTIEECAPSDIRAQFETNFFGALAVIKAALPSMRPRRRGHIINIGSLAGYTTPGGFGAYGATKLGLSSLSEALGHELAPFGIHVMMAVPGAFRTRLGHARVSVAQSVEDYREQNAARDAFLKEFSDHQRGDPKRAAAVLLAALAAPKPPGILLLGPDAVDGVLGRLAAIRAEIEEWQTLSRSTDLVGQDD